MVLAIEQLRRSIGVQQQHIAGRQLLGGLLVSRARKQAESWIRASDRLDRAVPSVEETTAGLDCLLCIMFVDALRSDR